MARTRPVTVYVDEAYDSDTVWDTCVTQDKIKDTHRIWNGTKNKKKIGTRYTRTWSSVGDSLHDSSAGFGECQQDMRDWNAVYVGFSTWHHF